LPPLAFFVDTSLRSFHFGVLAHFHLLVAFSPGHNCQLEMTVTVHFTSYPLTTRRSPPSSKYYGPKKDCLCRPASVWVRERTLAWSHLGALTPWGPPSHLLVPKRGAIGTNDTDGGVQGRATPPSPPAWAGVPRRHAQRRPHDRGGAPVPTPATVPPNTISGRRPARRQWKRIRNSSPKFFLLGAGGGIGPDTAAQRGRRPPTPWPRGAHSSAPRRTEEESPRPSSFFLFHPLPHPLILREKLR
jgi:hypothetical protein